QPFEPGIGFGLVGAQTLGFHAESGLITPDERAVGNVSFLFSHRTLLRLPVWIAPGKGRESTRIYRLTGLAEDSHKGVSGRMCWHVVVAVPSQPAFQFTKTAVPCRRIYLSNNPAFNALRKL